MQLLGDLIGARWLTFRHQTATETILSSITQVLSSTQTVTETSVTVSLSLTTQVGLFKERSSGRRSPLIFRFI